VLHEFFSTGVYRVRASSETYETSSPSMDISKASNFERFAFDLVGRDQELLRDLFGRQLRSSGEFDLSGMAEFVSIPERYGFVSGASSHADRVRTIREVSEAYGVVIDPHTADGVAVARGFVGDEPMIVLETALPVKFSATIVEAIGVEPERPARFAGIEDLPRRVTVLTGGVEQLKTIIESAS
jgi:threonine synthase